MEIGVKKKKKPQNHTNKRKSESHQTYGWKTVNSREMYKGKLLVIPAKEKCWLPRSIGL
jgi:hypothetical protein